VDEKFPTKWTKSYSLALFWAEVWEFEVILGIEKVDFEKNAFKVLKCPLSQAVTVMNF